jgi:AhpC/TSA family
MAVENQVKMTAAGQNNKEVSAAQTWWKESLEQFVKDFPNVEETPEALYRLGMANEYSGGKAGEAAARDWYARLAKDFPQNQLAGLGAGAVRRLDSEGQPFALAGQTLDGQTVNVQAIGGRPTLVYYWASWWTDLKRDAAFLAEMGKKANIVTVCMDNTPAEAAKSVNAVGLPGAHLFQTGGGLATAYGVMGPHLFLVGKDGKVVNKNAQIPGVADEVDRLLK